MPIVQPSPPRTRTERKVDAMLGLIIVATIAVALFSLLIVGTSLVGVVWAIIAIAQHGLTPLSAMVLLLAGSILLNAFFGAIRPRRRS